MEEPLGLIHGTELPARPTVPQGLCDIHTPSRTTDDDDDDDDKSSLEKPFQKIFSPTEDLARRRRRRLNARREWTLQGNIHVSPESNTGGNVPENDTVRMPQIRKSREYRNSQTIVRSERLHRPTRREWESERIDCTLTDPAIMPHTPTKRDEIRRKSIPRRELRLDANSKKTDTTGTERVVPLSPNFPRGDDAGTIESVTRPVHPNRDKDLLNSSITRKVRFQDVGGMN